LAWLTQFSLLGGELWFGVLSLDIHLSLTNPFTSYVTNEVYYTSLVYGIACITATILVGIVPVQFGLSVEPMIWVGVYDNGQDRQTTKGILFYMFMVCIYLYCGVVVVWARNQIHKGLEETLAARKYSVSKQSRCKKSKPLHSLLHITETLII
jgi:hypothetical protein